jgi:hypothetical protein
LFFFFEKVKIENGKYFSDFFSLPSLPQKNKITDVVVFKKHSNKNNKFQ